MPRFAASKCRNAALVLALAPMAVIDVQLLRADDPLQLFLDDRVIESQRDVRFVLHSPRPAEIAIQRDKPWEDSTMYDPVVIQDGDRYRMWYRANFNSPPYYTAYAESKDGIRWTKPSLGLVEYGGSKDNNIVWVGDHSQGRWRTDRLVRLQGREPQGARGRAVQGDGAGGGQWIAGPGLARRNPLAAVADRKGRPGGRALSIRTASRCGTPLVGSTSSTPASSSTACGRFAAPNRMISASSPCRP